MGEEFDTSHDMIARARRNLRHDTWDYICGGAESETSLRRNRMALDCIAFRPRVLRDVREIDTSATFLGHRLRIPVMLAPLGRVQTFSPNGALDPDTAAEAFGTISFLSTVTEPSLEEVAANSPHPKFFQIYVRGDPCVRSFMSLTRPQVKRSNELTSSSTTSLGLRSHCMSQLGVLRATALTCSPVFVGTSTSSSYGARAHGCSSMS